MDKPSDNLPAVWKLFLTSLCCFAALGIMSPSPAAEPSPRQRVFEFTYGAAVEKLPAGARARFWIPVPPTNAVQQVMTLQTPTGSKLHTEQRFGNQMLYWEATIPADGQHAFAAKFHITRLEVQGLRGKSPLDDMLSDMQQKMYLEPDSLVPIKGKPLLLLGGKQLDADPIKKARQFYDIVFEHMTYSKEGTGWGRGDVLWACDSKYGNCSDFHSLFISLARANGLPSRFEIGFPLPVERGQGTIAGYHCWGWFYVTGRGWIPVDISEADKNPKLQDYYFGNLTEDRVAFSIGRDLKLSPEQDGPPLNFFIYPYVEVDGQAVEREQIKLNIRYEDLKRE
jgi:transglutaminase-like putative cysteine protease